MANFSITQSQYNDLITGDMERLDLSAYKAFVKLLVNCIYSEKGCEVLVYDDQQTTVLHKVDIDKIAFKKKN